MRLEKEFLNRNANSSMENHQNNPNAISLFGFLITNIFGWLSHVTKDDVIFVMAIVSFLITSGYTIEKWWRMRKGQKVD